MLIRATLNTLHAMNAWQCLCLLGKATHECTYPPPLPHNTPEQTGNDDASQLIHQLQAVRRQRRQRQDMPLLPAHQESPAQLLAQQRAMAYFIMFQMLATTGGCLLENGSQCYGFSVMANDIACFPEMTMLAA